MSDIPVGSPPAPPGRHAAPGGWYPDPLDRSRERYWDGWQWSRNTRELEGPVGAAPGSSQTFVGRASGAPYGGPVNSSGTYVTGAPGTSRQSFTADGVPLAGWWWRALAGLIDAVITGVVGTLISLPIYRGVITAISTFWNESMAAAQAGASAPPRPDLTSIVSGTDYLMLSLVTTVVGFAYAVPFLRARGATPGMLISGLRVVPVDDGRSATRLSWSCILVRTTLWVVPWALNSFVLLIFTLVDVLFPLSHPKRQTLHDLAARTQVVKIR